MKDIMLKIKSDDGLELVTEGRLYTKGSTTLIQYDETVMSGFEGCSTSLTITPKRVRVKRTGSSMESPTELIFEKGRRLHGLYATPYGNFGVEILTNKISGLGGFAQTSGSLSIDYSISFKGLFDADKQLDIEILQTGADVLASEPETLIPEADAGIMPMAENALPEEECIHAQ